MPFSFLQYVSTEELQWLQAVYIYRDHEYAHAETYLPTVSIFLALDYSVVAKMRF
jgi:hypothetical protein